MTTEISANRLTFMEELRQQRWDDHRYYHHSRINQSLHLFSSMCFMATYSLIFFHPGIAALVGWLLAMWSRQIGHFFFEPKTYDEVNQATHEHKEDIKIGYNLMRKRVLLTIWGASPIILWYQPGLFGLLEPHANRAGYFNNLMITWLVLGAAALLFRTVHLFFIYNVQTGLVWATKILTDPFNDFGMYRRSPIHLMKGELLDPMIHVELGVDPEEADSEVAPT